MTRSRSHTPAALLSAVFAVFSFAFILFWPATGAAHHTACSALHDAAFMDDPEIVRDLLNMGVDVDCKNEDGHTPLITALEGASEDSIRLLLAYGADANALNAFGETPLQRAREQLSRFDAEKPERYARLFMDVIDQLQRAGGVETANSFRDLSAVQ